MTNELGRAQRHALPTLEGYTLLLSAVSLMHRNSLADLKRSRQMPEHLVERSRRYPAPYAIEVAHRLLKANRSHTSTCRALAIAQSLSGRVDEAQTTVQRLLDLEPSETVTRFLARTPAKGVLATKVADALLRAGLPA
jgi:hypothetical protein